MPSSETNTIIGHPLTLVKDDVVANVEGTIGNPIPVSKRQLEAGEDFYILFAAEKGQKADQVARLIREKYDFTIHRTNPVLRHPKTSDTFDILIDPNKSMSVHNPRARKLTRFPIDDLNQKLAFRFGDKADYYMIACHLDKAKAPQIFGNDLREVENAQGQPTGETIDAIKYDLRLAPKYLDDDTPEDLQRAVSTPDVMHRGALFVYERTPAFDMVHLSDTHLSKNHDRLEAKIIQGRNGELFLKFNNPNSNAYAIREDINKNYLTGKGADFVLISGDATDSLSENRQEVHALKDTNTLLLFDYLNGFLPPVFVGRGNHEPLKMAPPAWVMAPYYNIPSKNLTSLEEDIYERTMDGRLRVVGDLGHALEQSDENYFAYADINRFPTFKISFERNKQSPGTKDFVITYLDTGPNDLYHHKPNDEYFAEVAERYWPYGFPAWHFGNIIDFATGNEVDTTGASIGDIAWATNQSPDLIVGHSPLLNNDHPRHYDPREKTKIDPPVNEGSYWNNSWGAWAHHGRDLIVSLINIIDKKRPLYLGGHAHSNGTAFVAATDENGGLKIYSVDLINAFKKMQKRHPTDKEVAAFWNPEECTTSEQPCPEELIELYDAIFLNVNNPLISLQIGAAGPSNTDNPAVYGIYTIGPMADINDINYRYPQKEITPDPQNPQRLLMHYTVKDQPAPDIAQNPVLRGAKFFSTNFSLQGIQQRNNLKPADLVPSLDSLNPFPRINSDTGEKYIDKEWTHPLQLKFRGIFAPTFVTDADGHVTLENKTQGFSGEMDFNPETYGEILRLLLIKGAMIEYTKSAAEQRWMVKLVTPNTFDINVGKNWKIIALGFAGGLEIINANNTNWRPSVAMDINIFELGYKFTDIFYLTTGGFYRLKDLQFERGKPIIPGEFMNTVGGTFELP